MFGVEPCWTMLFKPSFYHLLRSIILTLTQTQVFGLAPVNVQLVVMELWPSDDHDQELMSACSKNDLAALEALLRCPRDPNVTGQHDLTPLHHAAGHGHIQPMQLLLEAAAKIDARSSGVHGMTPLHLAAGGGHLEAVGFLVQAGALKDSSDVTGATPLCSAAQEGCLEVVRYLLQQGAEKDQALDAGATPLFMAAQEGHLEIVRVLLAAGADHQKARRDGATAVSIARQEGHWEVVRLLEEVAEQTWQSDFSGQLQSSQRQAGPLAGSLDGVI